jgi:hypothetical protein
LAGQSGLDLLGTRLLAQPPADLLADKRVLEVLARLLEAPKTGATLKRQIAAVQAVRKYLDAPTFSAESLASVAAALAATPPALPPSAKGEVRAVLAQELARRARVETVQEDLEAALTHLGGVLADSPSQLYESLLAELRQRADFGRQADVVHALLAVALGAVQSSELAGKLEGLDGHAFAVASQAARRGGKRLLNEVDRRSEAWPQAARRQWGFLLAAVRPRGLRGMLRDTSLVLAGAGAATICWWAAQFIGH